VLPRSRADFIPAGKAPQRGADAVKACYPKWVRTNQLNREHVFDARVNIIGFCVPTHA
jgi:hypothetical protein